MSNRRYLKYKLVMEDGELKIYKFTKVRTKQRGIKTLKTEELKVIQEYETYFLTENELGFKESIHKHDLGLIKEKYKPTHHVRLENLKI